MGLEMRGALRKAIAECDVDDPDAANKLREWLTAFAIETLSVGGPSESTAPDIGGKAYALLVRLFRRAD
jgi:hypothetical protein